MWSAGGYIDSSCSQTLSCYTAYTDTIKTRFKAATSKNSTATVEEGVQRSKCIDKPFVPVEPNPFQVSCYS